MKTGRSRIDISGRTFGKWSVLSEQKNVGRSIVWRCRCECGAERWIEGSALRSGREKNCAACRAPQIKDISGWTFGLWTVSSEHKTGRKKTLWLCTCKCGSRRWVNASELRNEKSTNCGCVRREKVAQRNYKHGMGHTRLHARWLGMIARCENPKHKGYERYGGRGIKVCARWRNSFEAFLQDMGPPQSELLKIERKDNDGHYEPGNCRWATNRENCRNTRTNRIISYNGQRLTLQEWSEKTGLKRYTIYQRLKRGWPVGKALTLRPFASRPKSRQ